MSIAEKLVTVAENIPKVYNAGYEKGKSEGGGGTNSYYDTFWDGTQQNGERTDYVNWSNGAVFTKDSFFPKYDIKPVKASSMFEQSGISIDLEQRLKDCGVVLDFSKTTSGLNLFQNSAFYVLPEIDCSQATSLQNWFYGAYNLHTIRLIKVHSGITTFYNAFLSCTRLKEVRFEGEITKSISFKSCSELSTTSRESIFNALATVETTQTLTLNNQVKILQSQVDSANAKGWTVAGGTVVSEEEYYG